MVKDKKQLTQVVLFVTELMSQVRIEQAVQLAGFEPVFFEKLPDFSLQQDGNLENSILDVISRRSPGLIIFDLADPDRLWQKYIPVLKSDPSTAKIPILCFGPHVERDILKMATSAGADLAIPRSKFFNQMHELIHQWTVVRNYEIWDSPCKEPILHQAILGIEAFNQAEFFTAHELLEEAWNEDQSPGRDLYQAILQISVAYLQIQRRNFRGAVKMFFRVRKLIDFIPDECKGVDVLDLKINAQKVYDQLLLLGPEKIQHFDQSLFRSIKLNQSRKNDGNH
jgi:hypothetical protein